MKAKALEKCAIGPTEYPTASWRSDPDILTWLVLQRKVF